MIKLESIVKKFDHRAIAGLHGISLELKEGEIFSLMGPNGSGKSTLLNIISGSLQADAGEVTREGDVTLFKPLDTVSDINVQKFLIGKVTLDVDDEKKVQLARDLADIFEFTFQLRQKLNELSAGQRQKVLLASELINRPSLLLLDEPFTHLDPHTRKEILASLFTYIRQQGISLLWVTHDLEEALSFSDTVAILNFGKLEQLDSPVELILNPKNLFVAQFLGYENFIPVKQSDKKWETPWGAMNFPQDLGKDEAILVIPSDALEFSGTGLDFTVEGHSIQGLSRTLMLKFEERTFRMEIRGRSPLPPAGSRQKVSLRAEECFLIPL